MLKTVRSGRPLIHVMRAWSVVGPHLMEVTKPFPRSSTIATDKSCIYTSEISDLLLDIHIQLPVVFNVV